jgi:hypothetical protein
MRCSHRSATCSQPAATGSSDLTHLTPATQTRLPRCWGGSAHAVEHAGNKRMLSAWLAVAPLTPGRRQLSGLGSSQVQAPQATAALTRRISAPAPAAPAQRCWLHRLVRARPLLAAPQRSARVRWLATCAPLRRYPLARPDDPMPIS